MAAVIGPSSARCCAIIALALLANGCAGLPPPFGPPTESPYGQPPPPATPPPHLVPTLADNPELANDPDLILFMTPLADRGVRPLSSDTSQNELLRPAPGLGYRLDRGHLHVHAYPTAADAHQRVPQVRAELAQSIADWIGTPHLFECGRLLAMYFGDDRAELTAVDEACAASRATPAAPTATPAIATTPPTATHTANPAPSVTPPASLVTPARTADNDFRRVFGQFRRICGHCDGWYQGGAARSGAAAYRVGRTWLGGWEFQGSLTGLPSAGTPRVPVVMLACATTAFRTAVIAATGISGKAAAPRL